MTITIIRKCNNTNNFRNTKKSDTECRFFDIETFLYSILMFGTSVPS